MPITTKFDITHGPRAMGLNTDLLTEAAVGGLKNVANNIQREVIRLLGRRGCSGFENAQLPKKNKTALNKRGNDKKALNKFNYLKAIKEAVAFTRAKTYGRHRKEKTILANAERTKTRQAKERATSRAREEYAALTWLKLKRHTREHDLKECVTCNGAEAQCFNNRGRCNPECFEARTPATTRQRDSDTKRLTRLYCAAMYERTNAAKEMFYDQKMEPGARNKRVWMLFPRDKVIRIVEPSSERRRKTYEPQVLSKAFL